MKNIINLSRQKILQYGVFFIIFIFIFSTLNIYFSSDSSTKNNFDNIEAYAQANAVLASYETQLTVLNTNEEVLEVVKQLSKEGKILRNIELPNKKMIIDLKSSEDAYKISDKLSKLNAQVDVKAYIDLKNITLVLPNGEIKKLENKRIERIIRPLFEIGEEFEVQLYVAVQKQKNQKEEVYVIEMDLKNKTDLEREIELSPKEIEIINTFLVLSIPWEERKNVKTFEIKELNGEYSKKINDYIFFNAPQQQEILAKIAAQRPYYIYALRENGLETILDFNNKSEIENFFLEHNITLLFPNSEIEFFNLTDSEAEKIKQTYQNDYPNSKVEFKNKYLVKISFEQNFFYGGEEYKFMDEEITKKIVSITSRPEEIEKVVLNALVNKQKIKTYEIKEIKTKGQ